MRKTSQDGGDSTSITSGIENEIKKPGAIIKTKRNSIKRKVQNFSLESDDAVIEPLLQKEKEKNDTAKQSAKFNLLSKTKTEANSEKGTDKDKLISDDKLQKAALSNASDVTDRILSTTSVKENSTSKLTSANAPLHNHMNTNVFSNHEGLKTYVAPKSQILVEIDGSKHVGYNPSPLIFTTAKIHTDGKTKQMEPVQMTPVPILSTIEVSMKSGINTGETSGHVTSNISAVYIPQNNKHVREQDPKLPNTTVSDTTTPQNKDADTKIQNLTDKIDGKSNIIDTSSLAYLSNKEIKLTQPNIPIASVKDSFTGKNSIQNKSESQAISSTSEKNKTIVPHEAQSESGTIAFTKIANSSIKETKKDKADSCHPENKINLNETVKPESLDLQRTKPSDSVNSLNKVSKDKPKYSANTSFNSRHLQRQSIVLDKDDPMAKLKSNIVSSPTTNESKGIHKSGESQNPSTIEIITSSDKTKLPKTSANNIPITSVTSVSTNNSAVDSKIYASTTTAATLNKKPSSITSNIATNQTVASVMNSAVTNNPTTTTSTINKMSAATNKVAVSTITPAPINTVVVDIISSVPVNTPLIANKTSAANVVAPSKISALSTSTATTSNKISSPAASIATGNKLPSTSTVANKISNPMTTSVTTNKISSPSTTIAVSTKTSPSPAATAGNKISSPSSTNTASSKMSNPITTTSATNKISAVTSTINAASIKISSSSPTTMTGNKISVPSSTTTVGSKVPKLATTTVTAAINKISAPSTTSVMSSKISNASSTTTAGGMVSTSSITSTPGNKISSSTATTAATKKISSPVITTTAIKMTSGSTTTTTGVGKTFTSNSNSSVKPITSSSCTVPQLSKTPITKSTIVSTPSVSKPLNNVSSFTNIKSGTPNETSTTTVSTANIKPTTTAKLAKVTTAATPTTTSPPTTLVKSPTTKSVPTKTTPQPAVGKSTEITPKSSTIIEKPITAKSHSTSISSTTTSGQSSVTSTDSAVSSGSSPASAEAIKQSDSKSKVIGNGNKSFKA